MIFLTLFLLALMEVSLSFDNAVLNASILKNMDPVWQRRFILWGMPIAVIGMRLVFPILIVSLASHMAVGDVLQIAMYQPSVYAAKLAENHVAIAAFGGMFLLMVFLEFIFNSAKEVHWIHWLESRTTHLGLVRGSEILVAGSVLVFAQSMSSEPLTCLLAGLLGIGVYVAIQMLMELLNIGEENAIHKQGLAAFVYLEVLDASCSLDGVIGAFVLTDNIILIMIGLGIGALCVRSLTLYLVRGGTLANYIYLEHGAHYGIGALAMIMLTSIFYPVPEPVTGFIGMSFIGLSLLSSVKHNKRKAI